MPLPRIAIVGRPNVGKSSLLNRLARRRVSIVDPAPGVTRDRVSTIIELEGDPDAGETKLVEIVDTGGYGVYVAEGKRFDDAGADLATLTPAIEAQIHAARAEARIVVFVIDAQAGITALDETIARLLREGGAADRVLTVANKVDGDTWMPHGLEAAGFGLGEPVCVSAENGFGMNRLLETLYARIEITPDDRATDPELKVAIVGKRNAGKSTFVNALAGEPRVIVSEIAGTTRDSVDVRFEFEGRSLLAIDTAGLRKRKSFADDIEYYAYHRMLASIRRADVVFMLVDATEEISQVDKKLAQELQRQYKPTVIVVNKCDRIDRDRTSPEDFLDYLTEQLRGLDFAPIVFISALEREGFTEAIGMAFNLYAQAGHRESTGKLNRIVGEILKARGPSSRLGTQARLYYASQVDTHPPTLVLKVNEPKLFEGRYERYLMNRLRDELPFSEVPIRVVYSTRDRVSVEEMKERARQGARARKHEGTNGV